jgi:hypothetical protein
MKRWLALLLVVGTAIAVPAAAVADTQPVRTPTGNVGGTFDAGVLCPFPVELTIITDNEVTTTFSDGRQITTGTLRVRVTNLATGESLDANVSGPVLFTPGPDGTATQVYTGNSLFYFSEGQLGPASPAQLVLTSGPIVLALGAEGNVTSTTFNGTSLDVCAALA